MKKIIIFTCSLALIIAGTHLRAEDFPDTFYKAFATLILAYDKELCNTTWLKLFRARLDDFKNKQSVVDNSFGGIISSIGTFDKDFMNLKKKSPYTLFHILVTSNYIGSTPQEIRPIFRYNAYSLCLSKYIPKTLSQKTMLELIKESGTKEEDISKTSCHAFAKLFDTILAEKEIS